MNDPWKDSIDIDEESLKELKRLYNKAKPGEVFLFQGKELLREFAGYAIEYIETQLKGKSS